MVCRLQIGATVGCLERRNGFIHREVRKDDSLIGRYALTRRNFLIISLSSCISACGGPSGNREGALTVWGGQGRRDGAFIRPRAVAVYRREVYTVDTTGRIQVFDFDGRFLRMWNVPSVENGTPTAVGYSLDGRVVIPDTHYSRILEYSTEGELLESWGEYGSEPERFIYPTGIVQGADGTYFISEYGENAERVHVFGPDRKFLRQWGAHGESPGRFNRAMAIDMDAAGVLYVADTANHRVQCFDPQGNLLRVIGEAGTDPGQLKFPYDLSVSPDGTIVVCEYGTHRLSRFTAQGELVGVFGEPGRGVGQFNGPRGVAVGDDGTVFVADTDNHRIQRLRLEDIA